MAIDIPYQKPVNTKMPVDLNVSWVDRLIIWIDRQPWPAWLFYAALVVGTELLLSATFWIDGSVPLWTHVTLPSVSPPIMFVGLALYHYLSKAGSKALQDFRPVLKADDDVHGAAQQGHQRQVALHARV